jgi:transcriptional regulator with XRE-family HTH domain
VVLQKPEKEDHPLTPAECRRLRVAKGWSRVRLGRAARMSAGTVQNYEQGRKVSAAAQAKLAGALNLGRRTE